MKKLTILFAFILIVFSSFSQKLDNEFYFRFGYSNPSWKQFGLDKETWGEATNKYGGIFELGSIFMIQSFPSPENMAIGINVDYLYSNVSNFTSDEYGYEENLTGFRIGSKIGPSFTYSPMDKMAIDVFVKADIAWANVLVYYEDQIDDADDYFSDPVAVGFSTGLNFRYGILMLGLEFDKVSPKLESDDYPGLYFQDTLEFEEDAEDKKSKLSYLNFTLGLSF